MLRPNSLGHRSLASSTSLPSQESTRQLHVPPELAMAPMQFTNRSCAHSPSEDLPCARRIIKTTKQDGAVTHTWVSCKGTRYVSTTMALWHGVNEDQIAKDAALYGHTQDEHRAYRESSVAYARSISPGSAAQTDYETQTAGFRLAVPRPPPPARLSAGSSPAPSLPSSLR